MKRVVITIVIGLIITLTVFVFGMYFEVFAPYSTTFLPRFSRAVFYEIKKGDTKESVHLKLGKPFVEATSTLPCDYFSKANSDLTDFFGWVAVNVCYDKNNIVVDKAIVVFYD